MENDSSIIYDIKRKMLAKYPRFGSEVATANIENSSSVPSAGTDGKKIYVNPRFFSRLSEDEKIFTLAHEIMHIKFMHMYRLKGKDGNKKDFRLWNIATDAIINANLERDGFKIMNGAVNMPEALGYSAEEFYEKLLKEREKENQNDEKKEENQQKGEGQENDEQENQQKGDGQGDGEQENKENMNEQESNQNNEEKQNDEGKAEKDAQNKDDEKNNGNDAEGEEQEENKDKKNGGKKGKGQQRDGDHENDEQEDQQKGDGQENGEQENQQKGDGQENGEQENQQNGDGQENGEQENQQKGDGQENGEQENMKEQQENEQEANQNSEGKAEKDAQNEDDEKNNGDDAKEGEQEENGDKQTGGKNGKSQQKGNGHGNGGQEEQQNGENGEKSNSEKRNENTEESNHNPDGHSLWEEAFKNYEEQKKKKKSNNDSKIKEQEETKWKEEEEEENEDKYDEKREFEDNREEKRRRFETKRRETEKNMLGNNKEKISFNDIGKSKEPIDWKTLLKREVDKTEDIWSQRRSIAENNYAYRMDEYDIDEGVETEVMIDVSGSVSLNLVKAFLRQLKPIVKDSKLRVGCFNAEFWGFVDVKNEKDIDNFEIPREARGFYSWTEDWDLAVRSFTKKKEINKLVFTDGFPCPGTMPKEDLKRENVIWLVYGNKKFRPCCGKVINITGKQLNRIEKSYGEYDEWER